MSFKYNESTMKRLLFFTFFLFVVSIVSFAYNKSEQITLAQTTDCDSYPHNWHQVQNNPQHTGFSNEILGSNVNTASWVHAFQPEKIYPQVQAIIYCGNVYVGTEMGNIYAFDAVTGEQRWKYTVGSPILSSVAASDNNIYFGSLDGNVYALKVDTTNPNGELVWKSDLPLKQRYGFSASPVIADGKVMLGREDGMFYAFDLQEDPAAPGVGKVLWSYPVNAAIYQTAAYNNGKVYFGAMDMHVYALNTNNGSSSWKSEELPGMAFKDYWPVITKGYVFIRSMNTGTNFFALSESNGQQTLTLPQSSGNTMNGTTTPPSIDRNGALVIPQTIPRPTGAACGSSNSGWGTYDIDTQQISSLLIDDRDICAGNGNNDETFNVSSAQNVILALHTMEQGASYTGVYNQDTRQWTIVLPKHTNAQMRPSTLGGGGNPPSISNGFYYHISAHNLIARDTN